MSTLQSSVSVSPLPASQVADPGKVNSKVTMPVSLLESKEAVDSGSESMGLSDTDNDIGSNLKETLLCIKALNGETDHNLATPGKKNRTNGLKSIMKKVLSDTGSDEEYSSDGQKMLKTNIEKCISSLAEDGSNSEVSTPKTEDTNLFDDTLNNEDESILDKASCEDNSSEKADEKEEDVTDKGLDEDKLLSEDSSDKFYEDHESAEKLLEDEDDDSYDKLLNDDDDDQESFDKVNDDNQESSDKVNDDDKSVKNIDEGSMEVDKKVNECNDDDVVLDENDDDEVATVSDESDGEDDDLIVLPDTNSPHSDCSSKNIVEDENLSESKQSECDSSLSSNLTLSKKHPLLIGKNVKCSFKGIMKTAVSRVSLDSDSSKSSSPKPEHFQKSAACSSSGNKSPSITDTVADSSTMPDNRNLFDKLTSLSDLEMTNEPDEDEEPKITCSSQPSDDKVTSMETDDIAKRNNTPSDCLDEPMETETVPDDDDDDDTEKSLTTEVNEDFKDNEDSKDNVSLSADDQKLTESEASQDSVSKDEYEITHTSSDNSVTERSRSNTPILLGNLTTTITKSVTKPSALKPSPDDNCKSEVLDVKNENCDITSSGNNSLTKTETACKSEASEIISSTDVVEVLDSDMKSEIKDEKPDVKTEVLKDETVTVDSTGDSTGKAAAIDGERKRSANSDTEESLPKRSRLDLVIGKLGSQIGISPENIKCDEVMFDSDVDESCKESSESTETRSDDVTSEEDERTPGSPQKSRRLTEEVLEVLIKQKVRDLLDQQKAALTKQFQAKIDELTASNEAWKAQAKELHRRAAELISHQQRQERRRAVRTGGQRRNVAIQVGEERINSANLLQSKPPSTPPKSPHVLTSPTIGTSAPSGGVSLLAGKTTPKVSSPAARYTPIQTILPKVPIPSVHKPVIQEISLPSKMKETGQTVKSILENNRSVSKVATSTTSFSAGVQTSKAQYSQCSSSSPLVKVIDLTADEESSSASTKTSIVTIARQGQGQSLLTPPVRQVGNIQQPVPPRPTLLLGTSTGAQVVTSPAFNTTSQPRPSGVQYQYLYAAAGSTQTVRPGSVVTLVQQGPGGGSSGTGQVVATSVQSSTGLPQLTRPGQQAINSKSQIGSSMIRAPPPLMSAPKMMTASGMTKLSTANLPLPPPPPVKKVEVPKHPAALPALPTNQNLNPALKPIPPKPGLKISRVSQGIVLSWNMTPSEIHAQIVSYQLFAYQEGHLPPNTSLWKKVGDVKALPLPMACTLTQFQEGNKYHFAVRAVDTHTRVGPFSEPSTIHLVSQTGK